MVTLNRRHVLAAAGAAAVGHLARHVAQQRFDPREGLRRAALVQVESDALEALLEIGPVGDRADLAGEVGHDLGRRPGRREHAGPVDHLVALIAELVDRRHIRHAR